MRKGMSLATLIFCAAILACAEVSLNFDNHLDPGNEEQRNVGSITLGLSVDRLGRVTIESASVAVGDAASAAAVREWVGRQVGTVAWDGAHGVSFTLVLDGRRLDQDRTGLLRMSRPKDTWGTLGVAGAHQNRIDHDGDEAVYVTVQVPDGIAIHLTRVRWENKSTPADVQMAVGTKAGSIYHIMTGWAGEWDLSASNLIAADGQEFFIGNRSFDDGTRLDHRGYGLRGFSFRVVPLSR